ncbi:MAG TPA: biopolymer transporter ExbD [Syntrophorhabdaceae bacterium]|nr:biopolymer transporter ExbD [Syntrophorhabdaceae bacterium]HOL05959.1 biopolymer transporter ExbD [Syntrophorhabdaceae bacterium]HON84952.1 biopolymer transporter ExbD [Syntrophorhabdaceae bacterium]HOT41710.1 biopolymer transporter ExbD [Syntrophorhabdaceae bacterium]HPC66599.1 biopolymer transporter ExbD [Syntrophorhabdaceae bacterium]
MKASKDTKTPLSEINIIPLVDVMLVLLIIFMITAPMMQHGMNIDIPRLTTKPLPAKDEPQILSITKERQIILNEKKLDFKDLKPAVQFLFANKPVKEIYLRADKEVPYGFVVTCMGLIREAGVEKINIVTKPQED